MGKPIEGALERVLAGAPKNEADNPPEQSGTPLNVSASINRADYILVPQDDKLIGKAIILHGKNWQDTHYALGEKGLIMPSIKTFIAHFMNVKDAAEGRTTLYDGNNNPINRNESQEMWNYLASTQRTKGVCWTWLDALFKQNSSGSLDLETDHRVIVDPAGKRLQGRLIQMPHYLHQNGLVNLSFNSEGLPVGASQRTSYTQGENIYFYQPVAERVAWFGANSGWAYLICDRIPTNTGSSLGVFPCAEGASAKNSGGKP